MPTLIGWNPSTSLAGEMASMTFRGSICGGSGSWTRMPSTLSSAFSRATSASSSSSDMLSGKTSSVPSSPSSRAFFALFLT